MTDEHDIAEYQRQVGEYQRELAAARDANDLQRLELLRNEIGAKLGIGRGNPVCPKHGLPLKRGTQQCVNCRKKRRK